MCSVESTIVDMTETERCINPITIYLAVKKRNVPKMTANI